jgi:exosortase/archaeosortase family protein
MSVPSPRAGGVAQPGPKAAHRRRHWSSRLRQGVLTAVRIVFCALNGLLAVLIIKENAQFRIFEAWLAGHVIPLGGSIRAGTDPGAPIVWFAAQPHHYMALLVTPECTVAALIVPFCLCTAWQIWSQSRITRPLIALVIGALLLVAFNQLRLLTIVLMVISMGPHSGFYWGHTLLGSVITIFGVVFTFLCYAVVVASGRKAPSNVRRH